LPEAIVELPLMAIQNDTPFLAYGSYIGDSLAVRAENETISCDAIIGLALLPIHNRKGLLVMVHGIGDALAIRAEA
jgi:hypothetical protein